MTEWRAFDQGMMDHPEATTFGLTLPRDPVFDDMLARIDEADRQWREATARRPDPATAS